MTSNGSENMFAVLNPAGVAKEAVPLPLAPRVTDLSGKTIYCVSQHVGDADRFLKKVTEALPRMIPGAKAVFRKKTSAYMSDDPELWDEIKKEGAAFIYGCGA
jgi:hypothetical protein